MCFFFALVQGLGLKWTRWSCGGLIWALSKICRVLKTSPNEGTTQRDLSSVSQHQIPKSTSEFPPNQISLSTCTALFSFSASHHQQTALSLPPTTSLVLTA